MCYPYSNACAIPDTDADAASGSLISALCCLFKCCQHDNLVIDYIIVINNDIVNV